MGVGGFCFSFRFKFLVKFVDARIYFRGAFARFEVLDLGADICLGLNGIFDPVGAPFSGACREAEGCGERIAHREQPDNESARCCQTVASPAIELYEEWAEGITSNREDRECSIEVQVVVSGRYGGAEQVVGVGAGCDEAKRCDDAHSGDEVAHITLRALRS